MPKKTVVEMVCDRCGRTWYPEVKKDGPEPTTSSAAIIFRDAQGAEVVEEVYEVLCESCSKTVHNYLKSIGKDLKNRSPRRKRKKDGEASTSPSGPITPQQHAPHR